MYVAAPIISASGTVPHMAPVHVGLPWLATATLVAPSSWGEASDDVTFVTAGTRQYVPAAHWWLSENVKLGLIWGSVVHCDVFVLVCCAFCVLGNVHFMLLEVSDTQFVKVQGGGYSFWGRLS